MACIWKSLWECNCSSNSGEVVPWIVIWKLTSLYQLGKGCEKLVQPPLVDHETMLLRTFSTNTSACVNDATKDGCGTCWEECWASMVDELKSQD
jgi:hypothetical protein